jgi:hypothetical protein
VEAYIPAPRAGNGFSSERKGDAANYGNRMKANPQHDQLQLAYLDIGGDGLVQKKLLGA